MDYAPRLLGVTIFVFCFLAALTFGQSSEVERPEDKTTCEQNKVEREAWINEAERDQYTITRVSFSGNMYIRDRDLRLEKRTLDEGDLFTRKALRSSIKRLSKMKRIYPLTMEDVKVRLDRPRKDIEFLFCVKERPKK